MVEMYMAVESPGHALHRLLALIEAQMMISRCMKGTHVVFIVRSVATNQETVRDKEHEDALKELIGKARHRKYHDQFGSVLACVQ